MRIFLLALAAGMVLSFEASVQGLAGSCLPPADERTIHEVLLAHFHVNEGTVEVRHLTSPMSAERTDPAVAAAIADFNQRNGMACPAMEGPLTGLSLLAGSHRTRLSRVGFDVAGTTAVAEITMIGDPETGSGHFAVLKRDGAAWKVIEDRLYRMF